MSAVRLVDLAAILHHQIRDAEGEAEASEIAIARTRLLMKQKGFDDSEINAFQFAIEEIEPFDRDEAVLESQQSLIFYSDD